jgi:hypothetical protein
MAAEFQMLAENGMVGFGWSSKCGRPFAAHECMMTDSILAPRKMSTKNFDALAAKSLPVSLPYAILIIATERGSECTLEHIVCLELWSNVMRVA